MMIGVARIYGDRRWAGAIAQVVFCCVARDAAGDGTNPAHEETMKLRILKRDDVVRLLPMPQAIEQMRRAFGELSAGRAVMPMRSRIDTDEGDMHLMPACLGDSGLCVKMVLTYPDNHKYSLPVVQGTLMVFDSATGTPRALMDCAGLTGIRTGAGGGLAIELLSRRNSRVLGLIGAGIQARMQAEAAMVVRDIQQILVTDTRREAANALCRILTDQGKAPDIRVVDAADEIARRADILVTATTSPTPTFDGGVLRPGTHVNAVGSYRPDRREVDAGTVERAYVVVDSREASMHEAGELIIPDRKPDAELGEIVNGTAAGRSDDQQITLFKSVGIAVQDAAAASWVLEKAEETDAGVLVDL
jgi:ornithine cyclodeaminase/alanine dehydrogenase-like protein (mu-crystallin family)